MAVLAQLFGQVAQGAAALGGRVPDAVTVVVPAAWGTRQLPAVRRAAAAAGLGMVEVLPKAVAVGWHLLAGGLQLEPGAVVLLCVVDGGCAATVLRRTREGFEVVSSVDEETVAADMTAAGGPVVWSRDGLLREVVRRAMTGAQLAPGMADLVCAAGPGANAAVGRDLAAVCGVEPLLVAEPVLAGLLGAVQRGPAGGGPRVAQPQAGRRELVSVALPALWSLGLFGQFLAGAQRYGPREKLAAPGMVLASWGGLAVAAVFGLVAVAGGLMLATSVRHEPAPGNSGGGEVLAWVRHRLEALALAGGAAGGVAIAAMFSLVAASYFDLDVGPLLRWSVLPVLPAAVVVLGLAVVVWRRPDPPGGSWPAHLRFPALPVLLAGFGMLLIAFDETGSPGLLRPLAWQLEQWLPPGRLTIIGPVGRFGGLCIGVAVALLLARRLVARLAVGIPLALLLAGTLAWRVTGTVAVGFALVVAWWWAHRVLRLVLRPLLLRAPGPGSPSQGPEQSEPTYGDHPDWARAGQIGDLDEVPGWPGAGSFDAGPGWPAGGGAAR
ncbi:hypothetical protein [Dactylosporangium salmoneum]|uniref:hypothetical protein n=1 Tax=Dactylosporangium salmoneum TaxID=53361 RepID=UPI0031D20E68